jgi:hypothetical protein
MAAFIHRCPTTGRNVQGWFADDVSEDEGETYEAVTCLACAQMHLVNRSTGKVLGAGDKSRQRTTYFCPSRMVTRHRLGIVNLSSSMDRTTPVKNLLPLPTVPLIVIGFRS